VPCVISIGSKISRANIFRFKNYWLQHSEFKDIIQNAWNIPVGYTDNAKLINAIQKLEKMFKVMGKESPMLEGSNKQSELCDISS
jgi:hypothetical protein